jgi:hypothetical protein
MRVITATSAGLFLVDTSGPPHQLLAGDITAVTPDADGAAWWAIVGNHDLVHVGDGGESTETVEQTGEVATCVVATSDDVFVGTVGAHLLHLVDGKLARVESFEDLDARDTWTQPWGAPGDLRSFATDGKQMVFANVHVGGVLRTADGGETWVQTIDREVDVHEITRRVDDGHLLAATGAAALAMSTDDGATWEFVDAGLHGTYARAVAGVPGGLVMTASTGPFTDNGAVYRRRDGEAFVRCDNGIPPRFDGNIDSHWLASDGTTIACVAPGGTLYGSDDAAESWRELARGLPDPRAVLVTT